MTPEQHAAQRAQRQLDAEEWARESALNDADPGRFGREERIHKMRVCKARVRDEFKKGLPVVFPNDQEMRKIGTDLWMVANMSIRVASERWQAVCMVDRHGAMAVKVYPEPL